MNFHVFFRLLWSQSNMIHNISSKWFLLFVLNKYENFIVPCFEATITNESISSQFSLVYLYCTNSQKISSDYMWNLVYSRKSKITAIDSNQFQIQAPSQEYFPNHFTFHKATHQNISPSVRPIVLHSLKHRSCCYLGAPAKPSQQSYAASTCSLKPFPPLLVCK